MCLFLPPSMCLNILIDLTYLHASESLHQALAQPVYIFEAALYCMKMKYISTTGEALKELCVVLVGPLSNILVFSGKLTFSAMRVSLH